MIRKSVFWLAVALIGWTHVGFPATVLLRARLRPRPVRVADVTPEVTVVLAAHDEMAAIGNRVANVLAQDYPPERLRLVVASDGSTDGTVRAARAAADRRVVVLDLPRVGKAAALEAAVAEASGEILVFTDANTTFAPDAIRELVKPFADPEVGGVAGDQVYRRDAGGERPVTGAAVGEHQYWDLDRRIKAAESAAGSVISATGAIYAIRRDLFRGVPEGVTDDFVTSARIVEQGRRLVFAPSARAIEPVAGTGTREYARKVRIMTRGLRGVATVRRLLDPRRSGFYSVQLLSHKVLRRLMVLPLLVVAIVTPGLWRHGAMYRLAAIAQVAVYGLGSLGLALRDRPAGRRRILAIPAFFCMVNVAAAHAVWNLVTGRRIHRWEPARDAASPPDIEEAA